MICSNCGKEIKEGATYCLECGADIETPIVITELNTKTVGDASDSKEKNGIIEKGSFFDFSGYVKSLGTSTSALVALFGAILVYLSSFYSWAWIEQWGEKTSSNLFELGGKNGDMALNQGVLIAMAVLIILSAIDMLAFSASKYIEPLKLFQNNYLVRALPIVLTVIFFVIILENNSYSHYIDSIKLQEEAGVNLGEGYNFAGGRGLGPIMLIMGQVLYGVSIFLDYAKRNK